MTKPTKEELLKITKARYLKAEAEEKTAILNEFCRNTGYNRKYVITLLQAGHQQNLRAHRKKRKNIYGTGVLAVVIKIWELLEYPCGQRLSPALLPTAEALERCRELPPIASALKLQLQTISPKTLDRRLKRERIIRRLKKNRGTTRHGSLLKSSVPIRLTNWDTRDIGFMEMDTVAHNGGDPSGEFIYSLDMVEIATGWSEQIAVLGKGERGIVAAVNEIQSSLPFSLQGLDSDSGGEFVNWHMVKWCQEQGLFFTRSRPDRKNDNAYVEQKNYTHVRKWLGYRRYDTKPQLKLINDLYRNELRLFNNFFRPVMKIRSKEKINNSVCKKKYDTALTPYHRLLHSNKISGQVKAKIQQLYLSLNPMELKRVIESKLKAIRKS